MRVHTGYNPRTIVNTRNSIGYLGALPNLLTNAQLGYVYEAIDDVAAEEGVDQTEVFIVVVDIKIG